VNILRLDIQLILCR